MGQCLPDCFKIPRSLRYLQEMKRREFITAMSIGLATGQTAIGFESTPVSATPSRDTCGATNQLTTTTPRSTDSIVFGSALQAANAIRTKRISSTELTELVFSRIDKSNSRLHAFVYQMREEALERARKADEAQAKGRMLGPLHGVPIHVKESFAVAGHPCTWGIPALKEVKASENSEVVDRLLAAGAVLIGGTNVPIYLWDWQSYNEIYGTTNNPWDETRTPGGSSGGCAAALAAGLGYLSVGTDIGGSIRIPAHFCGVYGHKPTLDLVSREGHSPRGRRGVPGFSTLLAVAGPLSRSPEDLIAAMTILGGPAGYDRKAWRWELPEPRHKTLRDFRVGYVVEDAYCPLEPQVKTALEKTIQALEAAGAKLKPGWPVGFKIEELLENYAFHLASYAFSTESAEAQESERREAAARGTLSPGMRSFGEWQRQNLRRLEFRQQWQEYFEEIDVFLSPVAFTTAFPHDHSEPPEKRVIMTSSGPREYNDLIRWIVVPTLTGCPATTAPVGVSQGGLPVGIQILGPFWEDATPITFARLVEREVGGFMRPPGSWFAA